MQQQTRLRTIDDLTVLVAALTFMGAMFHYSGPLHFFGVGMVLLVLLVRPLLGVATRRSSGQSRSSDRKGQLCARLGVLMPAVRKSVAVLVSGILALEACQMAMVPFLELQESQWAEVDGSLQQRTSLTLAGREIGSITVIGPPDRANDLLADDGEQRPLRVWRVTAKGSWLVRATKDTYRRSAVVGVRGGWEGLIVSWRMVYGKPIGFWEANGERAVTGGLVAAEKSIGQ